MTRLLPVILIALAPAVALAESAMPSIGYTGAPADHNGQNCTVCHSSFAVNSGPGSLTVSITNYNPGVQQMIHVTVTNPTATVWGFQMTIREVSDETREAGTFSTVTGEPMTVVCDDGSQFGSAPPCNGNNGRQFAEHLNAPTTAEGAGYEWVVPWTPPETEVGRLHIYVSAVAGNGDGTPQGDSVYTYEGTLPNVGACALSVAPNLRTVMNGASFQPPFSSNSMITVFGTNFQVSGLQRTVGLGDLENNNTTFPTTLACVAVQVTGPGITQPVQLPIAFVEDSQINAQMPEFTGTGPVMLSVILNPGSPNQLVSDVATLNSQQLYAPAFFFIPNSTTIAAQIGGTSIPVADPSLVPGGQAAQPGQIVTLWGTGFGDFMQPVPTGQLATVADSLATAITVTIGTTTLSSADVLYAGASPGLLGGVYQFNVRIPASTPNGDTAVTITIGGSSTQAGLTSPVQQ
jgi:uncharacterized protein (TIGR03437 family)